jgi:hypothetical protein
MDEFTTKKIQELINDVYYNEYIECLIIRSEQLEQECLGAIDMLKKRIKEKNNE